MKCAFCSRAMLAAAVYVGALRLARHTAVAHSPGPETLDLFAEVEHG